MNAPVTFGRKRGPAAQTATQLAEAAEAAPSSQDFARIATIDEAAIAAFDACRPGAAPNDELLRGQAASALVEAMQQVLEGMRSLSGEKALRKTSLFGRLIGADIERQLDFEIGAAEVDLLVDRATQALAEATRTGTLMRVDQEKLARAQSRMERLATAATHVLATAGGEEYHRSRLERRLVDLEATIAASKGLIQQYDFAEKHLEAQCDKMRSVESLLLPVWKQHLFAVLHTADANADGGETKAIDTIRKRIIAALAADNGTGD